MYSYEQEEYPQIQKMILLLSEYFRYIVNANSDFVTLGEEMNHIHNYFDIQQVRYPETFFSMVEYDEEIEECLVPPLLIQNFAENSVKHSIKIGNHIDIFVIAQKLDEKHIRIRMLDTGEGINEEVIRKIECFRETGNTRRDSVWEYRMQLSGLRYYMVWKRALRLRGMNHMGQESRLCFQFGRLRRMTQTDEAD